MYLFKVLKSDEEINKYIQTYRKFTGLELDLEFLKDKDSYVKVIKDTKRDEFVAGVSAHFNDDTFRFLEYIPELEEDPQSEFLWNFLEKKRGNIVEGGGGFINKKSGLVPHLLFMIMMTSLAFKFYVFKGKKYSVVCTNYEKIKKSANILCPYDLYEGVESVYSSDKPGHYLAVLYANNAVVPFLLNMKLINVSVRVVKKRLQKSAFQTNFLSKYFSNNWRKNNSTERL